MAAVGARHGAGGLRHAVRGGQPQLILPHDQGVGPHGAAVPAGESFAFFSRWLAGDPSDRNVNNLTQNSHVVTQAFRRGRPQLGRGVDLDTRERHREARRKSAALRRVDPASGGWSRRRSRRRGGPPARARSRRRSRRGRRSGMRAARRPLVRRRRRRHGERRLADDTVVGAAARPPAVTLTIAWTAAPCGGTRGRTRACAVARGVISTSCTSALSPPSIPEFAGCTRCALDVGLKPVNSLDDLENVALDATGMEPCFSDSAGGASRAASCRRGRARGAGLPWFPFARHVAAERARQRLGAADCRASTRDRACRYGSAPPSPRRWRPGPGGGAARWRMRCSEAAR